MAARKDEIGRKESVPVKSGGGIASLRDEINRLFDHFSGGRRHPRSGSEPWYWDPFAAFESPSAVTGERGLGQADLSETDDGYELQVDLPGMDKDDISVDLSDGIVSISGTRSDEREDKRKGYYLCERSHGSVRRSFRVPDSVDTDRMEAQFKDGVLTLKMPRSEEAQKNARRIDVQ